MIDPGKLRERVTVKVPIDGRSGGSREATQTWDTFAERWASVDGLSSREVLQSGQQQTEITHRVRMRYLDGLVSTMRILWRDRVLEITSVLEHGNRSVHELLCQERVA